MRILKDIRLAHFLLIVLFVAVSPPCFGQEAAEKPVGNEVATKTKPNESAEEAGSEKRFEALDREKRISLISEKETNLSELIESIRAQSGFNIVLQRGIGEVIVPPIQLENVNPSVVLDSLVVATAEEIQWESAGDDLSIWILRNPSYDFGNGNRGTTRGVPAKDKATVHVINVADVLSRSEDAEASLLSALEIGLKMKNSSPEDVSLKLHKETKLLFVRSNNEVANLIYEVVDLLTPKSKQGGGGGGGKFGGGAF